MTGIETGVATLIAAGLTTATAVATPFLSRLAAPKPPKLSDNKTPTLGGASQLRPGERQNLINTSPQGVLGQPSQGRKSLLGG